MHETLYNNSGDTKPIMEGEDKKLNLVEMEKEVILENN